MGRCWASLGPGRRARNRRPDHPWRNCRRAHFDACSRWLGHDRPSGRLGCDRRGGRRRSYHNPRLLPGLRNDPSRSGRWGRRRHRRTLALPSKVWPDLRRRTLAGCTLASRSIGSCRLGGRTAGWWRSRSGPSRTRNGRGRWSYASGRARTRRSGGYRRGWSGGLGCLGLSRRRNGGPLGYSRSFIFSLLDGLEHVARLGDPRPVDLLLRLAVCLCSSSTILPAALKVLTYPFCFIAFQRAGVCFLFSHTHGRQGVKDRPALYFELAC
jgi:hypothetical protein